MNIPELLIQCQYLVKHVSKIDSQIVSVTQRVVSGFSVWACRMLDLPFPELLSDVRFILHHLLSYPIDKYCIRDDLWAVNSQCLFFFFTCHNHEDDASFFMFSFLKFLTILAILVIPSRSPSPDMAEMAWMCQGFLVTLLRSRVSLIFETGSASERHEKRQNNSDNYDIK